MRRLLTQILTIGALVTSMNAFSQDYPTRALRVIVPQSPGTAIDIVARLVSEDIAKQLGQTVVVENKTGANQLIGYEYVAKQAPADGYTVLFAQSASLVTLPLLVKELRFDPLKDLPPVLTMAEGAYILSSPQNAPWKTFAEMVPQVKANPGKFNYGTSGLAGRLNLEGLVRDYDFKMVHVPYGKGADFILGVVRGDVALGFLAPNQSYKDKIRVLASTGDTRTRMFPDVPTFKELGYPNVSGITISLHLRAGSPKAASDALLKAATRSLQNPEIRARLEKLDLAIVGDTPEAAAKRLADESQRFATIGKALNIQPQ